MTTFLNRDERLAQRVAKVALQFPGKNALFINGSYYTYKELFNAVTRICSKIGENNCYSQIGIYCNNDMETYAAILAVSLYGAAYVPLNKKYSVSRNKKYAKLCELELILSSEVNEDLEMIADGKRIIDISDSVGENSLADQESINKKQEGEFSYIMFTSGSTGDPKGVPVAHENVNAFFNYFLKHYDFNANDRFLQVYELTFDVSVFSFFMPLLVGACCYVLPDEGIKPVKTIEYLEKHKITIVSMVPTNLRYVENYFPEIRLPDLRYSFFSGDALYHAQALGWSRSIPNARIHNFYGPTETTIVCTRYIFDEKLSAKESVNGIVPLGKAFDGMEFLIVDENGSQVEKGELCFSGKQVISFYLNQANEEKFFEFKNKRYYKTGDLASVNECGNLVFNGRTDSQVKINGYRVELGEIENAVSGILNKRSLAFLKEEQLFVVVESSAISETSIKEALELKLPSYMIPQKIIAVEKFELNLNGKVDKEKLMSQVKL